MLTGELTPRSAQAPPRAHAPRHERRRQQNLACLPRASSARRRLAIASLVRADQAVASAKAKLMSRPADNPTPQLHDITEEQRSASDAQREADPAARDPIDTLEVFEMLRAIKDPEHPHTLEQLKVVQHRLINIEDARARVLVHFTPTIPHCSMATLIGLCIRVQLLRSLPSRFKVDVLVSPGSHVNERDLNKQLNDKERVCAALENDSLLRVVNQCLDWKAAGPW